MIGDQIPKDVQEHTCTCGPGPHVYPVWGSGPYTVDSPLCSAAVHAGVIGPEGGEITVVRVESLDEWPGSTANGVTTQPWEYPVEQGGYIFEAEGTEAAEEAEAASP